MAKRSKLETFEQLERQIVAKAPGRLYTGVQARDILTERLSSGIPDLDSKLGGGFPRAMITHIYGNKSSGKSSTVINTIATTHKNDPDSVVVVANCEGYWQSGNLDYAKQFGVDLNRLRVINSPHSEEILDIAEQLVATRAVDLFVLDSLAGLMSSTEVDKSMVDVEKVGENARMVQRFIKKLSSALQPRYNPQTMEIDYNPCAAIFINQLRTKFLQGMHTTQSPTGGRSVEFFSSIEIRCTAPKDEYILYEGDRATLKEFGNTPQAKEYLDKSNIGKKIYYYIEKNRTFPTEFQTATSDFYNKVLSYPAPSGFVGFGFDYESGLFATAKNLGVIEGTNWLTFEEYKAQGKYDFVEAMRVDKELTKRIAEAVSNILNEMSGVHAAEDISE